MIAKNHSSVDIVIVGAGLAGLAAALECKKRNSSFVVLEARNRPGGRAHTIHMSDGYNIDLGAHWVSKNHTRVRELIKQFNLQSTPTYNSGQTIFEINGKIRKGAGLKPLTTLGKLDLYMLKTKLKKLIEKLPKGVPLTTPFSYELDKQTIYEFIQNNMFSKDGKEFYTMVIEEIFCSKTHEISVLDWIWCIKSTEEINYLLKAENEWIIEGAGGLAERMADTLGESIFYESAVERISYQEEDATIFTPTKQWKAKKVIVAAPPNLTTRIKFDPPLPPIRVQLSERSGMPSVIKMIIIYDKPFWRKARLNGKVFSPLLFSMDSSPPNKSKGVLTILITGENAIKLQGKSEMQRKQEIIKALVTFFGHKASAPLSIIEKNWAEDEWTRGGYGTHYGTGVLTHYGAGLFIPVSNTIYWAGTEAATVWRTYMEGAVQSGQDTANEVIDSLDFKNK
ncbi:flavin monoamine oxidase family protein [Litchfieldia alkalitelluris]|uniref:flavin monoamine oxidase family protein n=1 Tax=Litchfieldia alkalitelluris TaxID=304268 RepID=UPI000997896A|nr:NAD(P)/FAD-dependent oxidoreductase [Litchfieldia alkalitelluris]